MARMRNILLNITDWLEATDGLSDRAYRTYLNLLCHYYRSGGPLPYDPANPKIMRDLKRKAGYDNMRSLTVAMKELIDAGKFQVVIGPMGMVLTNERADIEIARYDARRQGLVEGGNASRPYSKTPRPESAEPVSAPYQTDIGSISASYQADLKGDIEQKQQVSGSSILTLKLSTTTTQAHARGPVEDQIQPQAPAFPQMIPEMIEDPADAPAPKALVSKIPTPAPRPVVGKPCAVNPYIGPNAFNRTKPVPDEGTPEWDAYQRKQHRLAVTGEVKRIMVEAGVWNEAEDLDSAFIAGWLHNGADPELHIYPTVRTKSARMAEKGDRVRGIGIFTTDIGKLVQREKAIAANPAVFAEAERSQSRYSKTETPRLAITAQVQETIKMALQNKWEDLHDQMVNLLKAANAGDEQSLRLLNDLCANHEEDVRERYSDWCARRNSSAA